LAAGGAARDRAAGAWRGADRTADGPKGLGDDDWGLRFARAQVNREDVRQVVLDGLLQLLVGARLRVAVRTPANELGGVSEAHAFHVLVAGFDYSLRPQRREREVLVRRPTAALTGARRARAFFLSGPRPGVIVKGGDQGLHFDEQLFSARRGKRSD